MGTRVRVGDIVRLRSGGPDMTVDALRAPDLVECVWFDGGQRQTALFHAQTLIAVSSTLTEEEARAHREAARAKGRDPAGKPRSGGEPAKADAPAPRKTRRRLH